MQRGFLSALILGQMGFSVMPGSAYDGSGRPGISVGLNCAPMSCELFTLPGNAQARSPVVAWRQVTLLVFAALAAIMISSRAFAATTGEAYARGCGGCHSSESQIRGKIPSGPDSGRRAWLIRFMAGHPNARDDLKTEIVEYLVKQTATPRRWWEFWR